MISPVASGSHITRPTLPHFAVSIGLGSPPSTGTSTIVEYPAVPFDIPQAIRVPSEDQAGPEVEKPSGALATAMVFGSPLPSVFAIISDMSSSFLRTNANRCPSLEKAIGL